MSQEEFNPNGGQPQVPQHNLAGGQPQGQMPVNPAMQGQIPNQGISQSNPADNVSNPAVAQQQPMPSQPVFNGAPVSPQNVVGNGVPGQALPNQQATMPTPPNPAMQMNGFAQAGMAMPQPQVPSKSSKTKYIVWSIVGAVAVIILAVGGFFAYRHFSGDITGDYEVSSLTKDLKSEMKSTQLGKSGISLSEFSDDVTVQTTVENDVVKTKVSYSVDYDKFYDTLKSDYSSTYSRYKSDFSNDEWDYLMNTLIKNAGYDQDGFEDAMSDLAADSGFKYDADTGQVTGVVFEGKVNRVKHTIEVTKVNEDSSLGDLEKGKTVSYKKESSGLTLKNQDGDTMELKKK